MAIDDDYYILRQIDNHIFEYDVAIPDRFIEYWLHQNLEEGVDFNIREASSSLHVCTVEIKFLNNESATAFKLRWG